MNFNNSLTDVANAALSALGQPPVNSIESDVASARTCRLHLDACIRYEQQLFAWNELRMVRALEPLTDTAAAAILASEGKYSFLLPGDLLQVINFDVFPIEYRSGRVLCGFPLLTVEYTRFSPAPSEWSPELFRVVCGALAAAIAKVLTGDQKLADYQTSQLVGITRPDAYRMQLNAHGHSNYRDDDSDYRACHER